MSQGYEHSKHSPAIEEGAVFGERQTKPIFNGSGGPRVFLTFRFNKNWDRSWMEIASVLRWAPSLPHHHQSVVHAVRTGPFIFLLKWGLEEEYIVQPTEFSSSFWHHYCAKICTLYLIGNVYFFLHKIVGPILWICVCAGKWPFLYSELVKSGPYCAFRMCAHHDWKSVGLPGLVTRSVLCSLEFQIIFFFLTKM